VWFFWDETLHKIFFHQCVNFVPCSDRLRAGAWNHFLILLYFSRLLKGDYTRRRGITQCTTTKSKTYCSEITICRMLKRPSERDRGMLSLRFVNFPTQGMPLILSWCTDFTEGRGFREWTEAFFKYRDNCSLLKLKEKSPWGPRDRDFYTNYYDYSDSDWWNRFR